MIKGTVAHCEQRGRLVQRLWEPMQMIFQQPFGSSPQETGHRSKIPWVYINSGLKNTCSCSLRLRSCLQYKLSLSYCSKASSTFCHGSWQKMDPLVLGFIQIIHRSVLECLSIASLNSTSLPSAAVVRNVDEGLEVIFKWGSSLANCHCADVCHCF